MSDNLISKFIKCDALKSKLVFCPAAKSVTFVPHAAIGVPSSRYIMQAIQTNPASSSVLFSMRPMILNGDKKSPSEIDRSDILYRIMLFFDFSILRAGLNTYSVFSVISPLIVAILQ